MAGTCECGNEPSGSIKWGNFLTIVLHGISKGLWLKFLLKFGNAKIPI